MGTKHLAIVETQGVCLPELTPEGHVTYRRRPKVRNCGRRISPDEVKRRLLVRDLKCLDIVIRGIRRKLINRRDALAAYHEKGDVKRQLATFAPTMRRLLDRQAKRQSSELARFTKAAQAVTDRFNGQVKTKLIRRLRRYFEKAFWTGSKSARTHELLGCTVDEARQHLEKQFAPGMTWANHSFKGWHIDHKIPLPVLICRTRSSRKRRFTSRICSCFGLDRTWLKAPESCKKNTPVFLT